MFFSTIYPEYERNLLDEIWGCVKYIGIPYETVMNLPVHIRRYFIRKHKADIDRENESLNKDNSTAVFSDGSTINNYAKNEQTLNKQIGKH